jgi:membrane-associated phospholipid phosphatase
VTRMTYLSPFDRSVSRRRFVVRWGLVLVVLVALSILDARLWHALNVDPQKEQLPRKDWWQALRQLGYLPVWLFVGLCLALHDRWRARGYAGWIHRGAMVFLAAGLSGAGAELVKAIVRRGRPSGDGSYRYEWFEPVTNGLGLASSHAAVAFGGAIMLGWFFPMLRAPLLLAACGTGLTRLLVGAHYATDVFVALLIAYGVCRGLWRVFGLNAGAVNDPLWPGRRR